MKFIVEWLGAVDGKRGKSEGWMEEGGDLRDI